MNRLQILNYLSKKRKAKNYLEIGVERGHVFLEVKCPRKIAVDPVFLIGIKRFIRNLIAYPYNLSNKYFAKKSDDFFETNAPKIYAKSKIDLALVDGMHEYEFVLRDIENTVKYLSEDGVILVHDCNPMSIEASVSYSERKEKAYKGYWNGDVWKVILHIKSLRSDLSVFVLDCDQGIGVIIKKNNINLLSFNKQQIQALNYGDFVENKTKFLDLRDEKYFFEFFGISI